jgi:hypothetical protein
MGSEALWWGSRYTQVLQHRPRVDGHDLYGECQYMLGEKAVILTLMVGDVEESSSNKSSWWNVARLLCSLLELLAVLAFSKVCVITKRG